MEKLKNLEDLLHQELNDLRHSTRQQMESLPKLSESAKSPELKKTLSQHCESHQHRLKQLEKTFDLLNRKPVIERHNAGVEGLIKKGFETVKKTVNPTAKDASVISAAQGIYHYDIAGYGTASAYAKKLGKNEIAEILHETLEETKRHDQELSKLAEEKVNHRAMVSVVAF